MAICVPRPNPPSLPEPLRANGMPANGVPQTGCLRDICAECDFLTNLDGFCRIYNIWSKRLKREVRKQSASGGNSQFTIIFYMVINNMPIEHENHKLSKSGTTHATKCT